jgi:hypothetical protein
MRRLATLAVLASSCLPASAEVSEDLKFCGARKSAPERLACFEAVTRGASKSAPVRSVARAEPLDARGALPVKAAVPERLPARNPFDGYYAAIGGGYGVATGRDIANVSGLSTEAFFSSTSMHGPNARLIAGRNLAIGWGVIGFEFSGRWSGEKFEDTERALSPFGAVLNMPGTGSYSYLNDVGLHASIRAGATFDDVMIFGKVGLGATRITETFTSNEIGVQRCVLFDFSGCASFSPPGSLMRIQASSWLPSALFGIGVEKNLGSFFGRIGVDFEAFDHKSTSATGNGIAGNSGVIDHMTWTTRGTALIGVRF